MKSCKRKGFSLFVLIGGVVWDGKGGWIDRDVDVVGLILMTLKEASVDE